MPKRNAKLLIVDDESAIVEIIMSILSHCAYDFRSAYGCEKAVATAEEFHPDCVITGVMMQRMGGLQEMAAILNASHCSALSRGKQLLE